MIALLVSLDITIPRVPKPCSLMPLAGFLVTMEWVGPHPVSLQLPRCLGPEEIFGLQRMVCPCFSVQFLLHLPFQDTLCGPFYRTRPIRPHHPRGSMPESVGGYQIAIKPGKSTYWS